MIVNLNLWLYVREYIKLNINSHLKKTNYFVVRFENNQNDLITALNLICWILNNYCFSKNQNKFKLKYGRVSTVSFFSLASSCTKLKTSCKYLKIRPSKFANLIDKKSHISASVMCRWLQALISSVLKNFLSPLVPWLMRRYLPSLPHA